MNTRNNNARRVEEENVSEVVPPPAPQNPQVPIEEGAMSNVEIRAPIYSLTQVLVTQVARDARVQVNLNASTITSRIRDFTRINPPTFFCSNVEEDPQGFIDQNAICHVCEFSRKGGTSRLSTQICSSRLV